jgi:alkanesulfonate monooxygenase SsuD/methylene tetrahydromethanopterin reductase-like flavin-dependent oxidoreductase (luciferase family)
MRFSVWPGLAQPWDDVLEVAQHADATGWDGVWLADHFMGDGSGFGPAETPMLEATAGLAALAGATRSLRLGSLVFGMTYRHPAVLANWAATVDQVSHGRLVLGVGAGWQVNEHQQYGIDLPPPRERVDRFAEACEVVQGLLRQERTTYEGHWFHLDDALCEPKPVQERLPLMVGAKGNRMLGVTARVADGWNMWSLPADFAERSAYLDRRCERIGRDPREIWRSTQALVLLTDDLDRARRLVEAAAPRACVAGPVAALQEAVAGWAAVGVDELIIPDFLLGTGQQRREALDAIISEVAPAFRS